MPLLVGLIVLALGGAWYACFRWSLSRRLAQQIQWLESRGYPVTLEQLDDWYVLPDGAENAADLYLAAFASLGEWDRDAMEGLPIVTSARLPEPNQPLDEETCALMRDYLADNAETFEWLERAAQLKHTRYPVDLGESLSPSWDWLADTRTCMFLYAMQMVLAIETGDTSAYMESFAGASALVGSLSQVPAQDGQLVRIACAAFLRGYLERGLMCLDFTDEQLTRLSALLLGHMDVTPLIRGTAGQICFFIESIRSRKMPLKEYEVDRSPIPGPLIKPYWALGLADRDLSECLGLFQGMLADPKPGFEGFLESSRVMAQRCQTVPGSHRLIHGMYPLGTRMDALYRRYYAGGQSAQMALAVTRYYLKHLRLPDSLDELVPALVNAVPIDPFDGEPLRYVKQAQGFVVYTVGEDRQDNGGVGRNRENRGKSYDWPFTVDFSGRTR